MKYGGRNERGLVNFAFADVRKQLYSVPADQSGHGLPCVVVALSPSEGDIFNFLGRVARLTPQGRTTKRSISSAEPNEVSIVTWIKIGDVEILLAGDLENSGMNNSGLEGIVANHRTLPFGNGASLYKVGHHGSIRLPRIRLSAPAGSTRQRQHAVLGLQSGGQRFGAEGHAGGDSGTEPPTSGRLAYG
jgi:hypothetical protein